MKNIIAMTALCTAILFAGSTSTLQAQTRSKSDYTKKAKRPEVVYTCTMHTDVIAYKPGKCPKPNCGMTLVKKTDTKKTDKIKI